MSDETPDDRFLRLFQTYYRQVYGHLVRHMGFTAAEAEDLAQETFLSVYLHMDRIENEKAYIFAAARNKALNEIRRRSTQSRNAPTLSADEVAEAAGAPPPQETMYATEEEKTDRDRRLRAAMAELPPKTQECLSLRRQGLKYREIAEKMGASMDSVKARLREGRARLKARMDEDLEGEDDDDHEE